MDKVTIIITVILSKLEPSDVIIIHLHPFMFNRESKIFNGVQFFHFYSSNTFNDNVANYLPQMHFSLILS